MLHWVGGRACVWYTTKGVDGMKKPKKRKQKARAIGFMMCFVVSYRIHAQS